MTDFGALFHRHQETLVEHIDRQFSALNAKIDRIHLELHTMSDTFHSDLAAQTAAVQALSTEVSAGLAANAAAIQALKDQIANGTPVTEADLTALEGNTTAIQAATDALHTALNPVAAPQPDPTV